MSYKIDTFLNELKNIHYEWCKSKCDKGCFNSSYIRKESPELSSKLKRYFPQKSYEAAFKAAGINPFCHKSQINYGNNDEERKNSFISLVNYLIGELGIENLNDNTINSQKKITPYPLIPKKYQKISNFPECNNCKLIRVSLRSIYAQGRRLFGTWELAMQACGINYQEDILRKKASYPRPQVIHDLNNYIKNKNSNWNINSLRNENISIYRGIYNSDKDSIFSFEKDLNVIQRAVLEVNYLDDDLGLTTYEYLRQKRDWINNYYTKNISIQETWSKSRLKLEVLNKYVKGDRLRRSDLENSSKKFDKTLLASLRRYFEGDYRKALKYCGINLDKLTQIYLEEDDPFPKSIVKSRLINLLEESINTSEYRLSRKYVSENDKDLEQATIRHYGSWEKALKSIGLIPSHFQLSANIRARKGLAFQSFIEEFFNQFGFNQVAESEEIVSNYDYVHNRKVKECNHKIKCQPDFLFKNIIVDTKLGGNAMRQEDQMIRYLDHCDEIIIVSINDSPKIKYLNGKQIQIMGFLHFIEYLKENYNLLISKEQISLLVKELNIINFGI